MSQDRIVCLFFVANTIKITYTMKTKEMHYECPQVMVIHIESEGTLAQSYLDYKQNPSMPYGDDGEEWF